MDTLDFLEKYKYVQYAGNVLLLFLIPDIFIWVLDHVSGYELYKISIMVLCSINLLWYIGTQQILEHHRRKKHEKNADSNSYRT